MASSSEKYYLELSSNPIRFQSVSSVTNVFFDDSNRQVFTVRSGGATGVVVKGPTEESSISFVMEPKGPVISIKFSPNQKILAIQRSKTSVEFVNFPYERESVEYTQSCKGKNTMILGFVWTGNNEIAFITDNGIELFQVIPERRVLKALRSQSCSALWFVHCPRSSMVLLSSGTQGHTLQPFLFKPGNIVRLPKFEVEPPTGAPSSGAGGSSHGSGWGVSGQRSSGMLPERDVTLGVLYGNPSVLVLRHHRPRPPSSTPIASSLASPATAPPRSLHFSRPPIVPHPPANNQPLGAEIVIYTLQGTSQPKKSHILELNMSGRFAVNIVDNLVIVHHEASKTSVLYDIRLPGETDCGITRHKPVAPPRPIRPFSLRLPQPLPLQPSEPSEIPCDLYSPNWVVFQPDVIIDAKLGCLWCVGIQLEPLAHLLLPSQAPRLVHFLTHRSSLGGEAWRVLLNIMKDMILSPSGPSETERPSYVDPNPGSRLTSLAAIFDRLNAVHHEYARAKLAAQKSLPASGSSHLSATQSSNSSSSQQGNISAQPLVVLDQADMYSNIFIKMGSNQGSGEVSGKILQPSRPSTEVTEESWWAGPRGRFASAVLVEYIRSLSEHSIPVQHYLHEMLINALVRRGAFFQLHQFLQYHVIGDSKPLACLLLSLENVYPAAHTLALDMLRRLSGAQEEIVEVLLSRQQILPALRFVRNHGSVDQISARKYLEAARATGDPVLFASVFKYFEGRNLRLRHGPAFPKGEHCDIYVKHYQKLFGTPGVVRATEWT
ncbi:regulator of MON1-CCZ1 complex [Ischnura elegans]|uniref:regulator of MON1-CCZ1 complex n=1 Tax=Ischnura elegans TaxID=197161 RepID=UPI001ED8766D|nr:regulator of MON1-CCZ1 complex [Ischnura elegans]